MDQERRGERRRAAAIRRGDFGSYTALRWVSTLFRSAAIFLAVAVFAEFIAGLRAEGWDLLPFLLGELARATVISILLWGGGDLIRLLLQLGRDLRAGRVLLARMVDRTPALGLDTASALSDRVLDEALLRDQVKRVEGAAPEGAGLRWNGGVSPD